MSQDLRLNNKKSVRKLKCRLTRIVQSGRIRIPQYQSVYYYFYIVLNILVELDIVDLFAEIIHRSVDPRPDITRLPVILEKLAVLALLTPYGRSHYDKPRSLRIELKLINYLIYGLGRNGLATLPAYGLADTGIKKS